MSVNRAVWFNRISAVLWVVAGIISFPLGWANNVVLVWLASVYANVKTDWGTAAAENNEEVLRAIAELTKEVRANACQCAQPVQRQG
jgi:hypothetical protein